MIMSLISMVGPMVIRFATNTALAKARAAAAAILELDDNATEQQRIKADVRMKEIDAETARREEQGKNNRASKWYHLERALFIVPTGVWWIAITADNLHLLPADYDVSAYPGDLNVLAAGIIGSLFLLKAFGK